jgi:hypothetical protein
MLATTNSGQPLESIRMVTVQNPPAPPADNYIIGPAYDFQPDGAMFNPPITVTFSYDPEEIPEDLDLNSLSIANYNEAESSWAFVDSTVDTEANTVKTQLSHFTICAILGLKVSPPEPPVAEPIVEKPAPPPPEPTEPEPVEPEPVEPEPVEPEPVKPNGIVTTTAGPFTINNLDVSPDEVAIGESVKITVDVENQGNMEGTYFVELKVDGEVEATKSVTVAGGDTTQVSFSVAKDIVGSHSVEIDGQVTTFTVVEAIRWVLIAEIVGGMAALGLLIFLASKLIARQR